MLALVDDLRHRNVLSMRWTSAAGIDHGGMPITRGALYAVLTNPIYRGMIRHKGKDYPGLHPAIIDQENQPFGDKRIEPAACPGSPPQS